MESSLHPQGVQAGYPGAANPTSSSTDEPPAAYSAPNVAATEAQKVEGGGEAIESEPGIIEETQLAPLGEDKIVADPGLVAQATIAAKQAYSAVVGDSK